MFTSGGNGDHLDPRDMNATFLISSSSLVMQTRVGVIIRRFANVDIEEEKKNGF